jgi:hypothetical protein
VPPWPSEGVLAGFDGWWLVLKPTVAGFALMPTKRYSAQSFVTRDIATILSKRDGKILGLPLPWMDAGGRAVPIDGPGEEGDQSLNRIIPAEALVFSSPPGAPPIQVSSGILPRASLLRRIKIFQGCSPLPAHGPAQDLLAPYCREIFEENLS